MHKGSVLIRCERLNGIIGKDGFITVYLADKHTGRRSRDGAERLAARCKRIPLRSERLHTRIKITHLASHNLPLVQ